MMSTDSVSKSAQAELDEALLQGVQYPSGFVKLSLSGWEK